MITQKQLKSIVRYNPDTGVFIWIDTPSNRVKVGDIAGNISPDGYREIKILGYRSRLHRLAFLYMDGHLPIDEVDHINGVRNDNRWCNLRSVTKSENAKNKKILSNNNSGVTGVFWDKRTGRWAADIKVGYKKIWLGRHSDFF